MNFQFNRTYHSNFLTKRSIQALEEVENYLRAVYDHEANAVIASRISQSLEDNNAEENANGLTFEGELSKDECQGVIKIRITGQTVAAFYFQRTRKKVNGDQQVGEHQRNVERELCSLRSKVRSYESNLRLILNAVMESGESHKDHVLTLKDIARQTLERNS